MNEIGNFDDIKNVISTFSGTERHITVPRVYLEMLGDFNTAAFLNQLVFWSDKTRRSDGYFYKTYTEWNEELLLSEYQVRRSAKTLKEKGFIDTKLKRANGSPTLHYKVNMDKLSDSILKKLKKRNQTNLRNDSEVSLDSLTVDDTVDEQTVDSNTSRNSTVYPYEEIIEYLNDKANKKYKYTTRKTQSMIRSRFNEEFNLEDFKSVIDIKSKEWMNTDMEKYLRPETLFGTKFESYLNQKELENVDEISGLPTGSYDPLADVRGLEI